VLTSETTSFTLLLRMEIKLTITKCGGGIARLGVMNIRTRCKEGESGKGPCLVVRGALKCFCSSIP